VGGGQGEEKTPNFTGGKAATKREADEEAEKDFDYEDLSSLKSSYGKAGENEDERICDLKLI
jgi:hypothetical protein